tara:strand:- start:265 stop:915 length:651 start_codon:yes stop_codon:yes gene_type:complete
MNNDKMIGFVLSLNSVAEMLENGYLLPIEDDEVTDLSVELNGHYNDAELSSDGYADLEEIGDVSSIASLGSNCCSWTEVEDPGYHEVHDATLSFRCNRKRYRVPIDVDNDQVDWSDEAIDSKKTLCRHEDFDNLVWSSSEKKWFRFDGRSSWNLLYQAKRLRSGDTRLYKEAVENIMRLDEEDFDEVAGPVGYNLVTLGLKHHQLEWLVGINNLTQ